MRIIISLVLAMLASLCLPCFSTPAQSDRSAIEKVLGDEPKGWEGERDRYERVKAWMATQPVPSVLTYRKSPTELWVYDARPEFGIGVHGATPDALRMVRRLGVRFVRHTLYWHMMEDAAIPGKYDRKYLAEWDATVRSACEQGIELVVVVHGNLPGMSWESRRVAYRRFARFMGEMAKRYPSVRYWELWNEQNVAFTDLFGAGKPGEEGANGGKSYAEMLKLAYPAIKRSNPKSWVVMGGLAWDCRSFIEGVYEGGGRDYFDVMNIHSYGVPVNWGVVTRSLVCRDLMRKHGDEGKPIWITEFGIDAGNIVNAWGYAHANGASDGEYFDKSHLDQWRTCIDEIRRMGLYQKYLPYQFDAGNESGPEELKTKEYAEKYPPSGMTIDDYGFGLVRRDHKTPRPTYDWLLHEQVNRAIRAHPVTTQDVTIPYDGYVPVDHLYKVKDGRLTIRSVRVDSAVPTVIGMKKAG